MHTTKSIQGLGVVSHFRDVSMRDICRIHPIKTWDTYQTPHIGDRFAGGWIAWIDDRDTIDIKVVSIVPRSNVHRHRPDSVISFGHRDALASPRNIRSRQLNFLCVGGQDPKGRLGVFNLRRTDLGPPLKLSLCAWKGGKKDDHRYECQKSLSHVFHDQFDKMGTVLGEIANCNELGRHTRPPTHAERLISPITFSLSLRFRKTSRIRVFYLGSLPRRKEG